MGPDFLFIGAQRTASTWLFQNLRAHPDIWVPPNKSAVYFLPNFQKFRLKKALYYYKDMMASTGYYDRRYYLKYYSRIFPDDAWYLNLFPNRENLIKGELAEDYSALPPDIVQHIHKVLPQAKIILIMRKPWERAISHARLVIKKQKIDKPQVHHYLKDIRSDESKARTSYSRILKIWEKFYTPEQVFTGFYDDLADDPFLFLQQICTFLSVKYKQSYFEQTAMHNINAAPQDVPPEVLQYAAKLYEKETRRLAARFGGHTDNWVKELESILK